MKQLSTAQLEVVQRRVVNQQPTPDLFLSEVNGALAFLNLEGSPSEFMEQLVSHVVATVDKPNDVTRLLFFQWISDIDSRNVESPNAWAAGTDALTKARRQRVYDLLQLHDQQRRTMDEQFPVPHDVNFGFKKAEHIQWYDDERRLRTRHYAESLEKYLMDGGWSLQNIALVRQSAEYVVGSLADPGWASDPASARTFAGRGLVVGYVQSGKTTMMNLTIATAIDVGYKLVIVLGGLTDLLRRQTQRRFDKEVAGKRVLLQDVEVQEASGYMYAKDWSSFIEHGSPKPGVAPRNIERLTTLRNDYKRPIGNAFPPAWVEDQSSCRVVIIKKNKQRLQQLIKGIEQGISEDSRHKLSVLVLDDESDQATINTVNPRKSRERKGINQQLIKLLELLPNAQYVGVTATPAANCFTDPGDANDIYPRHFILPLARPDGYMGILDFHDLDDELVPIPDPLPQPNKKLHIRDIESAREEDDDELRSAIDAFVLTGALKLYRQSTGAYSQKQRHHTFFYSDSTFIADMNTARDRILRIWENGAFASLAGLQRLQAAYESDIMGQSPHRDMPDHFPAKFEDLKPYLSEAIQRIDQPFDGHKQVLVVNGEKDSAQIDFQVMDVWKIVVGGMKLSRGYTIEGLTITYFRRKSTNEAALMQMGRWFGYRAGYRDLVRLWISRSEMARPQPVDIYDFFESVCIDEETLRRKFREWYEQRNPDGSRITPIQIRPLISTVDSRLKPVAGNQMWNARLDSMTFSGVRENTVFGSETKELSHNERLWKELLAEFKISQVLVGPKQYWYTGDIAHSRMTALLESVLRPDVPSSVTSEALFRSFLKGDECRIEEWTVLMPQIAKPVGLWKPDGGTGYAEIHRSWRDQSKRLKTIADKGDRLIAHLLTETRYPPDTKPEAVTRVPSELRSLASSQRAVILLYPIRPVAHKGKPILGFEIVVPEHPIRMGWVVVDPSQDSPVVAAKAPRR